MLNSAADTLRTQTDRVVFCTDCSRLHGILAGCGADLRCLYYAAGESGQCVQGPANWLMVSTAGLATHALVGEGHHVKASNTDPGTHRPVCSHHAERAKRHGVAVLYIGRIR